MRIVRAYWLTGKRMAVTHAWNWCLRRVWRMRTHALHYAHWMYMCIIDDVLWNVITSPMMVGWVRAHLTDHGVITRHVLCVRLFISGSQYAMALAFHLIDRFNVSHKNMTRCWKSVHCGVASRYSNVLSCRQGPQEQPTVPTTHTHTHTRCVSVKFHFVLSE